MDFVFNQELVQALQHLASERHATLFMVLLAAFDILLSKYSNQTDIVVGTPFAGRLQPQLQGVVGYLANPLAVRVDLSGNPSFDEVIRRVRDASLGAFEHALVPIQKVIEAANPGRDGSHHPLFQVMFNLQSLDVIHQDVKFINCTVEPIAKFCRPSESRFDLTLEVMHTASELKGTFEFTKDLFSTNRINRMVSHYLNLLEGLVKAPSIAVGDVPMISDDERTQLIVDFGRDFTHDYMVSSVCLHELFHNEAKRNPESTCLIFR